MDDRAEIRDGKRKFIAVGAMALGVVAAGFGRASAGSFNHATQGANINGVWSFAAPGAPDGSSGDGRFLFSGTLEDTVAEGNAVKLLVASPSGATPVENYNPFDQNAYYNHEVFRADTLQTDTARAYVCRARGSVLPDNCSTPVVYNR